MDELTDPEISSDSSHESDDGRQFRVVSVKKSVFNSARHKKSKNQTDTLRLLFGKCNGKSNKRIMKLARR